MDFKKPSESKQTFMYFVEVRRVTNNARNDAIALRIAAPSIPHIETRSDSIER